MRKCLVKMKTRYFMLGIFYVAGIFNSFSNSESIVVDENIEMFLDNSTSTQYSSDAMKWSGNDNLETPTLCQQRIISHINNRYASTVVTTIVTNRGHKAQEYMFSFHIPNYAFITSFVIEVNDKNYTSVVLAKEEANKQFKKGGASRSSKLSESDQFRNTQIFSIPINLEALSMTVLYLSYEELLIRNHGRYEHVLNIFPGQLVEDLHVGIFLKETNKIIDLEIPYLRSGKEIENNFKELDSQAYISEDRHSSDVKSIKILFMPDEEEQRKFASIMKTDESSGFAGQFVVQYDVESNEEFGEIVVSNGYFVNFFVPKGLDRLIKHLVFVLDTSGSMNGIAKRIIHLKVAMKQMVNQLRKRDLISLVQFNSAVKVWNLESETTVVYTEKEDLETMQFPKPTLATLDNIKKAIDCVNKFTADGGTDILSALKTGLKLVELGKKFDQIERQPLIMFLTDGEPTVGEKSHQQIKAQVTKFNWGLKSSPISTLAFGADTNTEFLQDLAILNNGTFKHIYEAEDAQLQMLDFFNTISVPVLANVNFNYNFSRVSNTTLTKFPLFYDGTELIVAGRYADSQVFKQLDIEALSTRGPLKKQTFQVYNSTSDISHLWAFLTIKQLLNKIIINSSGNQKDNIKKILDMCLKYSFLTPVTSMVVVKPNEKVVLGTAELTQANSKSVDETMRYIVDENLGFVRKKLLKK